MLFQRFMASARLSLKINQGSIIMSLHKNIIITSLPHPKQRRKEAADAAKPCGDHIVWGLSSSAQPRAFHGTFPGFPWRFLPQTALFRSWKALVR